MPGDVRQARGLGGGDALRLDFRLALLGLGLAFCLGLGVGLGSRHALGLGLGGAPGLEVRALALGPLVVDRPVFMEMALGGIVSGATEPVAGIVGFDAFKSAVVEVGPGGAPVRIYDPKTFKADARWAWHELALVSNVEKMEPKSAFTLVQVTRSASFFFSSSS